MRKIVYQLTIEDIQTVAMESLDRELTKSELKKVAEIVPDRMSWFEPIEEAINEVVPD